MVSHAVLLSLAFLGGADPGPDGGDRPVFNGSFEAVEAASGAPAGWAAAGNAAVQQRLTADAGREGGRGAKLECTEFGADGPDAHAMICQVGRVSVRRGHWYRLTFWARAEALATGSVEVSLVNTRGWVNSGLNEAFTPGPRWGRHDLLFRAQEDIPAATSRLQFWFRGTGTLWLDDVALAESSEGPQWYPQLATEGLRNVVPNSSFECGTAGWGSITYGLAGWGGNLYRLEAGRDAADATHGGHSLKIHLDPQSLPVYWFDYYEPVRQPVRRVLAANRGWFRVRPGEPLTLAADLRADADDTVAVLGAIEAPERWQRTQVRVGTRWGRHTFTFTPSQPFVFIAVGLDLEATGRDAGTLWLDAVQLERGDRATAYAPRRPLESFLEAEAPEGHIVTDVAAGATLVVRAYNDSDRPQTLGGTVAVTDFFDEAAATPVPGFEVPPRSAAGATLRGIARGRRGAFRATWAAEGPAADPPAAGAPPALRFALVDPIPEGLDASPFGFNHAYPWDYLVRLARRAGIVWWRDWSAKWETVEPARGRFDFAVPDAQIGRVLDQGGSVEVLLPFPSASWSTTARPEVVAEAAKTDRSLGARLPVAFAPADLDDFGRYAAAVVRHYRRGRPRGVTHFQVLNEPVYTSYALPRRFGYTLDDYLDLLGVAYRAMKAADPDCRVVGGTSSNLASGDTREFVARGGLGLVDVFDLHMYDPPRPAENYEGPFRELEELMRAHGGPRPVWITEWGCYADDDPPVVPQSVGDATMNRCRWPDERAATEHAVKFAAVAFAHGVRAIFFHAGTCGPINGPDAGGVLFEYGGAPRKMYAGVAAFTRLVGVPEACVGAVDRGGVRAYIFRSGGRAVAVAWGVEDRAARLTLDPACRALDIMGNPLPGGAVPLGPSPVYLVADDEGPIRASLPR